MSRFETPPRIRDTVCRLRAVHHVGSGGITVRFRASLSGQNLGDSVVQSHTRLKEVTPFLRACFTSRPHFQISLVRGEVLYEEAGV